MSDQDDVTTPRPSYLGDGLYAEFRADGTLELFAWNGVHKHDRVYLDSHGLVALLDYLKANNLIEWSPKR